MSSIFRAYDKLLVKYPLPTKAITGFILSGSGDIIAQKLDSTPDELFILDKQRTMTYACFGSFWTGPVNHHWLPRLQAMFPGKSYASTLKKVFVQQAIWNPIAFMPAFYLAYGTGMGLGWEGTLNKARNEYSTSLIECWKIWVPTTMVVFRMPERFQSVTMAATNIVWNSRLSWISATEKRKVKQNSSDNNNNSTV
jgi:hypothetical protein